MALITNILSIVCDNPATFLVLTFFCLPLILLFLLLFPRGGHRDPFARDHRRPPAPLVRDKAARDRVLKQGFVRRRVPEKLDAIVIGSGMSGLASASILSRSGWRVLVLEQHDVAGGSCHTFHEKGYEFDVGVHYIGEMDKDIDAGALVDFLTDGQLQWNKLHKQYDSLYVNGKCYPVMHNHEEWKKSLLQTFPSDSAAVNRYVDLIKEVGEKGWPFAVLKMLDGWIGQLLVKCGLIGWLSPIFQYSGRSLQDVIEEMTDNTELQAVMAYNFGDHGMSPRQCSFFLHAIVQNHFLMHGAYYPLGGSSEIAYHLIPTIERAGGAVLVRAPITEIILDEKKAACGQYYCR